MVVHGKPSALPVVKSPSVGCSADVDKRVSFPSRFLRARVIRGISHLVGFLGSSDSKELACNAGDLCSIRGLGRSPGVGNGNPLQYPCLENSVDKEVWWAVVHGVTKS